MPKATVRLASGAIVNVEGTVAEVKEILSLYGEPSTSRDPTEKPRRTGRGKEKAQSVAKNEDVSLSEIVRHIKECDEADDVEKRILDTTSQVNRILLPLFVVHKYMGAQHGLTSGEISTVTRDLGIPIHVANVSNALTGSAGRYVIGDSVRRKGQTVRYKLSRRGAKYIENVIEGKSDGD